MANTKIPSELIADSSITAAKLADGTITTADIADSNVTTAKIADSNVTTAKIGDAQVTTAKITDANVTTGKIADDAVTTAKMASNSVTSDTIASGITLAGTTTLSSHLVMGDSDTIKLGDGADGTIHHDGSHFRLRAGTGNFNVQTNDFHITDSSNSSIRFNVDHDGATTLFHNGNSKLQTTSSGVNITGTTTTDGLTVNSGGTSSNLSIRNGSNGSFLNIYSDLNGVALLDVDGANVGGAPRFQIDVGNVQTFRITEGGDIGFYEDTGSTAKLYWDASAENLGIGTTTPSAKLDVNKGSSGNVASFKTGAANVNNLSLIHI